jgi:hypothetical protein
MVLTTHTSGQVAVCALTNGNLVNVLGTPEVFSPIATATKGWRRGDSMPCTCIVECEVESLSRKPGKQPPPQSAYVYDVFTTAVFGTNAQCM